MPGPKKRLKGERAVVVKLESADRAVLRTLAVERYAAGEVPGITSVVRYLRQEAKRRGLQGAA